MSRSNPSEELVNPCSKWFSWDAESGKGLKQYNKETKKNELIPMPFRFILLDRLSSVTGYNEPEKIGYYANEVRNIKDKLTVRSKNGIEFEGPYEAAKEKLGTKGLDFCQSVYIAYFEGKTLTLANIKMKGAALGNWFNFCKENKVMELGITLKESKSAKKGKVEYFEPVFATMPIKDETNAEAVEIDKELQAYLNAYLERNKTTMEAPKLGDNKPEETKETPSHTTASVKIETGSNNDFLESLNMDDEAPF